MQKIKSISPIIPYLAVFIGMFIFKNAWVAIGLYHLGMIFVLIRVSGTRFPKQREFRNYKPNTFHLFSIYLFYALSGVVLYFLLPYFSNQTNDLVNKLASFGLTNRSWLYFAIYFCIVNSILEELFWRGYHLAHISNDTYFAGYHIFVLLFFAAPIWLIPVFVICLLGSWLWRQLYDITGNLRINIISHIIADLSIVIAVTVKVFR